MKTDKETRGGWKNSNQCYVVGEIFGSFSADDYLGDKNIAIDVLDFSSSFQSGACKVYPSFIDYVLQEIDEIGRLTEVLKIRIR